MSKNKQRIICSVAFGVLYGLMLKYFGFQVTIITVLVMIFIELFIK